MTAVGLIEKKTQARVVALFRDTPNRNFQVLVPKPNEQTAIAAVISDRDAEIAALQNLPVTIQFPLPHSWGRGLG